MAPEFGKPIHHPRERQGDSVNETAQLETPHVGIFWVAQTSNYAARLLAAGCPLDQADPHGDCLTYGPGHYETWAQMGPRPDCRSRPARHCAVLRIRRLAARPHRLRPGARSVRPLCRSQANDTGKEQESDQAFRSRRAWRQDRRLDRRLECSQASSTPAEVPEAFVRCSAHPNCLINHLTAIKCIKAILTRFGA
jgi:hypothetical protein